VRPEEDLPPELRATAATLGLDPRDVEGVLDALLAALEARLGAPEEVVLAGCRERDALAGREIAWTGGHGTALGIAAGGGLRVRLTDGSERTLEAGEVHLAGGPG
jgi:biotin-(acetyl-CoA carboxylase) ligase